jgi:hypothetical protein
MTLRQLAHSNHRWLWVWAALALLVLAVPRLITAAPLDLMQTHAAVDPGEHADQNFPGSAFFFAEGAFDPVPGVQTVQSEHVLGLDEVVAAPAVAFRGMTALDDLRAANCLTSAIYYEAGNEPEDGQRAVAQVVLNRVHSPLWPNSVCGVVYQGSERTDFRCQFTFSCDGSMARVPNVASWARARRIAVEALAGVVYKPVGLATHYHTLAVRPPWSATLQPVGVIGAHIFYRNNGFNGTTDAFRMPYSRRELISGPARTSWPVHPVAPVDGLIQPAPAFSPPAYAPATPVAPRGWTPLPPPARRDANREDSLPESTIRPEYRNTGRPLI